MGIGYTYIESNRGEVIKKLIFLLLISSFRTLAVKEEFVFTRDLKKGLKDMEHCRPISKFDWAINKLCGKRQAQGFHLCSSSGTPYYLYVFSTKRDCEVALDAIRKYSLEKKQITK